MNRFQWKKFRFNELVSGVDSWVFRDPTMEDQWIEPGILSRQPLGSREIVTYDPVVLSPQVLQWSGRIAMKPKAASVPQQCAGSRKEAKAAVTSDPLPKSVNTTWHQSTLTWIGRLLGASRMGERVLKSVEDCKQTSGNESVAASNPRRRLHAPKLMLNDRYLGGFRQSQTEASVMHATLMCIMSSCNRSEITVMKVTYHIGDALMRVETPDGTWLHTEYLHGLWHEHGWGSGYGAWARGGPDPRAWTMRPAGGIGVDPYAAWRFWLRGLNAHPRGCPRPRNGSTGHAWDRACCMSGPERSRARCIDTHEYASLGMRWVKTSITPTVSVKRELGALAEYYEFVQQKREYSNEGYLPHRRNFDQSRDLVQDKLAHTYGAPIHCPRHPPPPDLLKRLLDRQVQCALLDVNLHIRSRQRTARRCRLLKILTYLIDMLVGNIGGGIVDLPPRRTAGTATWCGGGEPGVTQVAAERAGGPAEFKTLPNQDTDVRRRVGEEYYVRYDKAS
ncbi:hypothetical protein JB92DRAFT_2833084 [Gautieria morchelliformis]|nr:hypothetical protein JB92DRAFT_2833084 [Gautieria morchelliformis]